MQSKEVASAQHLSDLLDDALKDSFPASDPVAIDVSTGTRSSAPRHSD
jgi:hypothetical protein